MDARKVTMVQISFSAGCLLRSDVNYYYFYIINNISISSDEGWLSLSLEALLEMHHKQYASTYSVLHCWSYFYTTQNYMNILT